MDYVENPFHPGVPCEPDGFIGRAKLIQRIEGAIFRAQIPPVLVAIGGQRRIGKTSLLLKLAAKWQSGTEVGSKRIPRVVFVDCQGFNGNPFGWLSFASARLRGNSETGGSEGSAFLDLKEAILSLPENSLAIIMLDEVDVFESNKHRAFLESLRAFLISGPMIGRLCLVTSSRRSLEIEWKGSPLFNLMGARVAVGFLESDEVEALLARGSGFLTSEKREFLRNLGGPHPHFLHAAGSIAWEVSNEGVDPIQEFKREVKVRFGYLAEVTYGDIVDKLPVRIYDDLIMRALSGKGSYEYEPFLRGRLLINREGLPYSEGLRAFCVADPGRLQQAIVRRLSLLPASQRELLRNAALSGEALPEEDAWLLQTEGWLGKDNRVIREICSWILLDDEE